MWKLAFCCQILIIYFVVRTQTFQTSTLLWKSRHPLLLRENSCTDPAYVDKLTNENNGVKYLLVQQDPFDRTVDAKRMRTKDSEETGFLTMITKKNGPTKIWVGMGTEFAGEFKKIWKAEGIQLYPTLS